MFPPIAYASLILYFCTLIIFSVEFNVQSVTYEESSSDGSQEEKLLDALILVEILKSEYDKIAKENQLLRMHDDFQEVTEGLDLATCAASSNGRKTANQNLKYTSINEDPSNELLQVNSITPKSPLMVPNYRRNLPDDFSIDPSVVPPYGYFRRRLPEEYYSYPYYDNMPYRRSMMNGPPWKNLFNRRQGLEKGHPYRRQFDDVDPFGSHPPETSTSKPLAETTASPSPEATTTTTLKETTIESTITQDATSNTINSKNTAIQSAHAEEKTIDNNNRNKEETKPNSISVGDKTTAGTITEAVDGNALAITAKSTTYEYTKVSKILQLLYKAKRLKLLASMKPTEKTTKDPIKSQVANELISEIGKDYNVPKKLLKIKKTKKGDNGTLFTYKTSLKVYLRDSSKMPLPLPENNGYCFLHPKSALCGTVI